MLPACSPKESRREQADGSPPLDVSGSRATKAPYPKVLRLRKLLSARPPNTCRTTRRQFDVGGHVASTGRNHPQKPEPVQHNAWRHSGDVRTQTERLMG